MLSPAKHHLIIPKDPLDHLDYRERLIRMCLESGAVRKEAVAMCRDDVLFYVNSFAWTFRPKVKGDEPRVVPFVTWGGQDEIFRTLVDHIDRQRDLVAEKSRDAGWSWACCLAADWLWRFHRHTKTAFFSRIGDLVDSKDPDSLFWKLRFIQKWLPDWLWPAGWSNRLNDTKMHLQNPETESVITGQATTQDMGVAGRCTWAMFDEFSRVPDAKSVLDNTKDTSDCRVFVSTHTGPGTAFHNLCTNGVTDKIVTHWSEHPAKAAGLYRYHPGRPVPHDIEIVDKSYPFDPDYPFVRTGEPSGGPHPCLRSPWYDLQDRERSRFDVRTNLDIDVAGSTEQFFNATLIRQLLIESVRDPDWVGDVVIDSDGDGKLVELETGPLSLWIRPNMRGEVRRARYGISCDISAGTGATPSCGTIADRTWRMKVGEYSNAHVTPERFATVIAAIGRLFVDMAGFQAKVIWDGAGSVGKSFRSNFMRMGYSNVYYKKGAMTYAGVEPDSDTPGWFGNNEAKAALLMHYASALEKRSFHNPSERALRETLQFRWKDGRVEHALESNPAEDSAARDNHADHAIADALGVHICDDDRPDSAGPQPDPEPQPGSWEWRRRMGERADSEAADRDWQ